MRKFLTVALLTVISVFILTACSKSGDENKSSQSTPAPTESADVELPDIDVDDEFEAVDDVQGIELGDTSVEVLKQYPQRDNKSLYVEFTKECPEEAFLPEQDQLKGNPFTIRGTVTQLWDSMSAYQNELIVPELAAMLDFSETKGFTLQTDNGPVIVADLTPVMITYLNDGFGDDLRTAKIYKTMFDGLKPYEDYPEEGDTIEVRGFYIGYNDEKEYALFTYGTSKLLEQGCFGGADYSKFRTTASEKYKYKNYFECQRLMSWSEPYTSADTTCFIFYGGDAEVDFDFFTDEMEDTLENTVNSFFAVPEGMVSPYNITKEEYFTLSDGKTPACDLEFDYYLEDGTASHNRYILFQHKHAIIMIQYVNYAMNEETAALYDEDFENFVASITPCGF